jgi:ABC-type iron transport system FetAB ATPase subunit
MLEKETLHFKVGLSGSSSKKHPEFRILVNGHEFVSQRQLTGGVNETEYFEFDAEIDEVDCSLIIEFLNKAEHDTVLGPDGNITEDLLLNIDSVEIDDIDIGTLLWTASDYKPNYFETHRSKLIQMGQELPETVKDCVNLGWNGKWQLPFTSPFYIWLLENM